MSRPSGDRAVHRARGLGEACVTGVRIGRSSAPRTKQCSVHGLISAAVSAQMRKNDGIVDATVQRRRERDNPEPGQLAHPPSVERPGEHDAARTCTATATATLVAIHAIGGWARSPAEGTGQKPHRVWPRAEWHTPQRSDRRNPSSCGWSIHSPRDSPRSNFKMLSSALLRV